MEKSAVNKGFRLILNPETVYSFEQLDIETEIALTDLNYNIYVRHQVPFIYENNILNSINTTQYQKTVHSIGGKTVDSVIVLTKADKSITVIAIDKISLVDKDQNKSGNFSLIRNIKISTTTEIHI